MARTPRQLVIELRAARERRGWTQAELARRASVSREYIVRLETGKLRSELGSVMDVANALGFELTLTPFASPESPEEPSVFGDVFRRLAE